VLNCQDAIVKSWDSLDDSDEQSIDDAAIGRSFKEKYQVPEDVSLFMECDSRWAKEVDQWIKPFAAGQLTEDLIQHEIIGQAMEMTEYDYPWVFLGVHANFYEKTNGINTDEADREIIEIGSRSKFKSRACKRWQAWHDDILMNSVIKNHWGCRGYKYNLEMYKEDYENLKRLYNQAKLMSSKISDPYWQKVDAPRKIKHPLPKNWQEKVEDANDLLVKYRDWRDYDKK
jgi:hypothetical protein